MRVLVLVPGPLERSVAGPSIRGWETARAFAAAGHEVTVGAAVANAHTREGIRVVPRSRRRIFSELLRHDVVHGPVLPPYVLAALTTRRCVGVADLYDPVDLELGSVSGNAMRRAISRQLSGRRLHLRWADIVVSANDRQLERLREELSAVNRRDPGPELLVVPMGVPDPPQPVHGNAIRDLFPAIGPGDPVILWWGSLWRWLDAPTAIEAIALLAARRPNVRLVFTAGRPPHIAIDHPLNAAEECRNLARARGLLDRNVFFIDQWLPHEERHRYLMDADVGLTLHGTTGEARLAARFRYTDYVWAELPCVLAAGDLGGGELAAAGAARLVPPHDPIASAAALDELISNPEALEAARLACRQLADAQRWSLRLAPLVARVEAMTPAVRSPSTTARVAGEATRYYAQRAADRALAAFS